MISILGYAVLSEAGNLLWLLGDAEVTIEVGSTYADAGATASDNYDGDITADIVTVNPVDDDTVGSYTVTYNVTDSQGNAATEATRTVNVVDTTAPIITLVGANPQTIEVGSVYTELGATAFDVGDGDLTASIVIDASAVDTAVVGSYVVTYDVTDSEGNAATQVIRTVNVVDTTAPVLSLPGDVTVESGSTLTVSALNLGGAILGAGETNPGTLQFVGTGATVPAGHPQRRGGRAARPCCPGGGSARASCV